MFFSGYYYQIIRKIFLKRHYVCLECSTARDMYIEVGCRVHHAMYVPLYANKKSVVVSCSVCNSSYYPDGFPSIPSGILREAEKTPFRWTSFIGSGMMGLLALISFILMIIGQFESSDRRLEDISNVSTGKIIFYELDNGNKTCMYVTDTSGDTLYVRQNMKAVKQGKVSLIDEPKNYSEEVTIFSRKKVEQLSNEGKVSDICTSTTAGVFNPELFE